MQSNGLLFKMSYIAEALKWYQASADQGDPDATEHGKTTKFS